MDIDEGKAAIKEQPWLLMSLISLYIKGALEHMTLYRPDAVNEKYVHFCDKLTLKNKPYLLVIDDDVFKKEITGAYGEYHCFANLVILPRSVFESFQSGDSWCSYITAHELGHAKAQERFSRRRFIKHMGAIANGLVVGAITGAVTINSINKIRRDDAGATEDIALGLAGAAITVMSGVFTVECIMNTIHRIQELTADEYAKELIPSREIIAAMVAQIEKQFTDPRQMEKLRVLKAFCEEVCLEEEKGLGRGLSDIERDLLWAIVLAQATQPDKTLAEIIAGGGISLGERLECHATNEYKKGHSGPSIP